MNRADRSRARMSLKVELQLRKDIEVLKALAMHTPEGRAAFVQAQSVEVVKK